MKIHSGSLPHVLVKVELEFHVLQALAEILHAFAESLQVLFYLFLAQVVLSQLSFQLSLHLVLIMAQLLHVFTDLYLCFFYLFFGLL